MTSSSESTPFLANNNHRDSYDDEEGDFDKSPPTNAHFRGPIRILTILISFLSLSIFSLLIASYILLNVGPFEHIWGSKEAIRDLAIGLLINFILSVPTIFFQVPILVNVAVHITTSTVILFFSEGIFGRGWPQSNIICQRWGHKNGPGSPFEPLPEAGECFKAKKNLLIMMSVSAGVSFAIGLLILATLLLRLKALFRAKFWERQNIRVVQGSGRNRSGYTMQFTLSVLPGERPAAMVTTIEASGPSSSAEEGRLVEI